MVGLIALVALAIALYALYEIDKIKKADSKIVEKESKDNDRIKMVLKDLRNHNCEIRVKKALLFIDVAYSVEGIIIDLDDEWFLIRTTGKKPRNLMIRLSLVKDVKELVKDND